MWQIIKNWLNHFLNDKYEGVGCRVCEELKRQLEIERARYNLLLDSVVQSTVRPKTDDSITEERETESLQPIQTNRRRFIPYAVRQQMARAEDNRSLELLKSKYAEIHSLNSQPAPDIQVEQDPTIQALEEKILNTDALEVNG